MSDVNEDVEAAAPRTPLLQRKALWVALALALVFGGLVAVLATRAPAGTRASDSPLLGRDVPDVGGTTIDGQQVQLRDLQGRWVLVNFFATWCVPCRKEHPELISWQQRHAVAGDAEVIGVIYDDSITAVRRFRKDEGGDWPMLKDPDGHIALEFGVSGVPESYLISPEGVVVAKVLGGVLDGELEKLLTRAKTGGDVP